MSKNLFDAYCAQHDCHPEQCWEEHNPKATRVGGAPTPKQHAAAIAEQHLKYQRDGRSDADIED